MDWYIAVLKKYAVFEGRARRKEFWMFVLFNMIFGLIVGLVAMASGLDILNNLYSLAVLIPSLAVSVRRLHDVGKSGWMILVAFIPVIGFIWLLVLDCTEGTRGANQYGPDPKEALAA